MRCLLTATVLFASHCFFPMTTPAQTDENKVEASQIRDALFQSINDYRFVQSDTEEELKLIPKPLLRWSNPISGVKDGIICGWVNNKGRPTVMAQSFITRKGEVAHEFQSLATMPLNATISDDVFWEPATAGIDFKPISFDSPPDSNESRRLQQMRQISRQYQGEVEFKINPADAETSVYELRLLSQPVFRYGEKDSEIVDGAVFALVQGTNPEAWLLLETRTHSEKLEWYFAVAPMTGYAVRVKGPNGFSWEHSNQQARGRQDLPYKFRIHAKELELNANDK